MRGRGEGREDLLFCLIPEVGKKKVMKEKRKKLSPTITPSKFSFSFSNNSNIYKNWEKNKNMKKLGNVLTGKIHKRIGIIRVI